MSERNDEFFDDFVWDWWKADYKRGNDPLMVYWTQEDQEDFEQETGLDWIWVGHFMEWLKENRHYDKERVQQEPGSKKYHTLWKLRPTWELLDKFKLEQQKQIDLVEAQALF